MIKKSLDDDDSELFRSAMRGVKPLSKQKAVVAPAAPAPYRPRKRIASDAMPGPAPLSDFETLAPVTVDDLVEFKRTGIQHKVLRKLRAGQYNAEAILDLHGMTAEEAKESLYRFILQCQQQEISYTLIIHGKGRSHSHPVLKNKLNHWLRQLDHVLAFCSAKAKDGRSGAMYVLLKQRKGENAID